MREISTTGSGRKHSRDRVRGVFRLLSAGVLISVFAGPFVFAAEKSAEARPAAGSVPAETNRADQDCSDPEICFNEAVRALSRGDSPNAVPKLNEILDSHPDTPWAARAAFRLGTVALSDQNEAAGSLFRRAMPLKAVRQYVLFYRAEAARLQKGSAEALADYRKILSDFPDSALRPETQFQMAMTLKEAGDCPSAMMGFDEFTARYRDHDRVPEAFLNSAQCALLLKNPEAAIQAAREVMIHFPADPAAQEAGRILDEIEAGGVKIPPLTPDEQFHRAETLYGVARYDDALEDYRSASRNSKGLLGEEATVKLAMTHIQLKEYPEALRILTAFIPKSKIPDQKLEGLFWLARVAVRLGDEKRLLSTERKMSVQFGSSEKTGQILIYLGGFYEDRNRPKEAVKAYRRVMAGFKGNEDLLHQAVWRIGWMQYRDGRYQDAVGTFTGHTEGHSEEENLGQFLYWTGRSKEQLGDRTGAADAYRSACSKAYRTYYCQMAQERLGGLSADSAGAAGSIRPVSDESGSHTDGTSAGFSDGGMEVDLSREPSYRAARELLVLGLNQEASKELEFLTEKIGSNRAALFELSTLLYEAGDYYRSLRILRIYFQDLINETKDGSPAGFWKRVYPFAIVEKIKLASVPGSADPYIVAAVIREESAFNREAISVAGAVGLMQLMPYTAEWVADRIGHPDYDPGRLVEPEVNIRLGSWYLGHLAREFDGSVVPTIASYNAGPDAVSSWMEKRPPTKDSWDEFIESIPFSETRAFTKRVLRSYTEYLRLADANPFDRFDRPILSSR